jgi:hypothetical protein
MEVEGKIPTGSGPGGRSAVGIMLADRMRRPTRASERRQLSAAVSDRGWSLSVRFGMGTALAELCIVDQEEAAREAWGLPCRIELILLVAGGVNGPELDELVRVVRTHAPRTRIYRWTGTAVAPFDRPLAPPPVPGTRRIGADPTEPEDRPPREGPVPESDAMFPPSEEKRAGERDPQGSAAAAGLASVSASVSASASARFVGQPGGVEGRTR